MKLQARQSNLLILNNISIYYEPILQSPTLRFNDNHTLSALLGYTVGNGINEIDLFSIAPWGAEFENDLKNINGRDRDLLLTAWYAFSHSFSDQHNFTITIGIIDSSDFLDENEFANDEYHQFMSDAFVNNVNHSLPTFDRGGAFQWRYSNWGLNFVFMNVGENDDGRRYDFWGTELSYKAISNFGEGNYRFFLAGTSKDFYDAQQEHLKRKLKFGISFDQAIYCIGFFSRVSWLKQDTATQYSSIYSAGLEINGKIWADRIGIAYAYLPGGNLDLNKAEVFEAYYKYTFNPLLHLTLDIQRYKPGTWVTL